MRLTLIGRYDAGMLHSAMQVALARLHLRKLRAAHRERLPMTLAQVEHANVVQGRCGRDYTLTPSGCLLPQ